MRWSSAHVEICAFGPHLLPKTTKYAQSSSHRSRTQADSPDPKSHQFPDRRRTGHGENVQRTAKIRNQSANCLLVEKARKKDTIGSSIAIGAKPLHRLVITFRGVPDL